MVANESLSSILGWISIACWIVVYSPQVYENYVLQSGEGLSVMFVLIWLAGDLTNLAGAVLGGLLPTVILLALYYTTCDFTLLFQIYYYRWKRSRQQEFESEGEDDEETPLVGDSEREEAPVPVQMVLLRYALALGFVVAVGMCTWWVAEGGDGSDGVKSPEEGGAMWWTVQALGWTSAVLFLGARIPQILKNFKTRCAGLSPALFFFSICGNTTYALSIVAASDGREYLVRNGGWLAGSGLTVFLDVFVLCQFWYYQ